MKDPPPLLWNLQKPPLRVELKLPLATTKATDEITGVSSDFWKFLELSALETRSQKEGKWENDSWIVEKFANSEPRPWRNQWTLSVSSAGEPMALSWSQSALKEREYLVTLQDPHFKCCKSSLRQISWILDR
jgi:hypothetical protein